ncbi:hypothetical protein B0T17DRAFT_342608 [Bombardia bombarda]|uniref:Uncharacterized protein n=1 Tax=Bombardia bombarda TaxID=252184 RepID=A0AA39WN98_9PEZI|nr:hypothetical protein B0T17DRAFT_342608 [Bombardia bombarda]
MLQAPLTMVSPKLKQRADLNAGLSLVAHCSLPVLPRCRPLHVSNGRSWTRCFALPLHTRCTIEHFSKRQTVLTHVAPPQPLTPSVFLVPLFLELGIARTFKFQLNDCRGHFFTPSPDNSPRIKYHSTLRSWSSNQILARFQPKPLPV